MSIKSVINFIELAMVFFSHGGEAAVWCCGQWMDHRQSGAAVKDKATTEKTGNSMSSGLKADGREAGGRRHRMGPYLP